MTLACPLCGATLDRVIDGLIGETWAPAFHVAGRELPIKIRSAPFWACTGCEWVSEIPMTLSLRPQLELSLAARTT